LLLADRHFTCQTKRPFRNSAKT